MSHPAVEAFERRYAERSGVTVEFLHAWGRFGAVCAHLNRDHCAQKGCEGYEMLHLYDELLEAGWTAPGGERRIDGLVFTEPDWAYVESKLGHETTEVRREEWAILLGRPTTR